MRELVVDLRRAVRSSADAAPALAAGRPSGRGRAWLAAAAALAVPVAAAVVFLAIRTDGPATRDYTQLTHFADSAASPALSPDGRILAFFRGESTIGGPIGPGSL